MSVEYKAIYGYGYHITGDMVADLDEDKYEEFIENNFTHIVNGWCCSDDYFFGIAIKSADEGEIIEIPVDKPSSPSIKLIALIVAIIINIDNASGSNGIEAKLSFKPNKVTLVSSSPP